MFRAVTEYIKKIDFHHILISLKNRNFRLYFGGMCVSLVGTWIQQIAMSWLVYKLTGSLFLLAMVTFMSQIPILLITPFVSVFVDRIDKRKILLFTQSFSMFQALLLALLTFSGTIAVWHILSLSLLLGCINALDNPTRQAFYPGLIPRSHLGNAIALNSTIINGSRLVGPAIGGILIGLAGESWCFLLNGISYIGVISALLLMRLPQPAPQNNRQNVLADLTEGFIYVSGSIPLRSLLLLMSVVSFFGLPLMTFIPAYVKDILGGDSAMLGYLLSCTGIGSLLAALLLAARRSVPGLSKVISISACCLGLCLLQISFITTPWIAAILCIITGFTIITAVASINTLLQTLSDEDKRGRVMGYLAMAFTGITPLGSLALGALEKYTGLPSIIFVSGICCLSGALLFEYFRPLIHKHAHPIYIRKGFVQEATARVPNER